MMMSPAVSPWYCDGCRRPNPGHRYQCQQCRGMNTYDLCEMCIARASVLHPNHTFQLVSHGHPTGPSPWNPGWGPFGAPPGAAPGPFGAPQGEAPGPYGAPPGTAPGQ